MSIKYARGRWEAGDRYEGRFTTQRLISIYIEVVTLEHIFPETFTVAPTTIVVGIAVTIIDRFRWVIRAGWTLTVLGMGLLYLLGPDTSIPAYIFLNLVPGLGNGLLFASTEYAIQAAVDEKDVAHAEAMFTFLRTFGQAAGVAVGGVIFQGRLRVQLEAIPSLADRAVEFSRDASSLVQIIKSMPRDEPERTLLIAAYANSLKVVWVVMSGLAFVALVLSLFTEQLSLDRALESEQAFIHESSSNDQDISS